MQLTRKVTLFSMPIKLKIKLMRKSSLNLDSFAKNGDSWEFLFDPLQFRIPLTMTQ